jgi:hypothetical protein
LSEIGQRNPRKTKVKNEHVRKVHVVMTHRAIEKLTREELNAAKYGIESDRPEREAVNLIERPRVVEPLTFSLANLLPVGV